MKRKKENKEKADSNRTNDIIFAEETNPADVNSPPSHPVDTGIASSNTDNESGIFADITIPQNKRVFSDVSDNEILSSEESNSSRDKKRTSRKNHSPNDSSIFAPEETTSNDDTIFAG